MAVKTIILATTMIFSISWTLLASTLLLPKLPSNGQFCRETKFDEDDCRPFSYTSVQDLLFLSNLILGTISLHAIIGSALGLLGGLLVYIVRGRALRKL